MLDAGYRLPSRHAPCAARELRCRGGRIRHCPQCATVPVDPCTGQCDREPRGANGPIRETTRDSSAIEEVADLALLLYRDDVYAADSSDPDTIEVVMAKNRNGLHAGRTSRVWLTYRAQIDRVEDRP